ncbi:hypothetical protein N7474_009165 [Penicillium riverlandense]|uniref:uncharacterized protein n=1 Tax=Penicillium riverlandense TaxID=1903569 RepID=UPI0025466672|nr:uncharacterized protein N7474_009165 [Penicillium riverlandense]KAJ5807896.1 hypothetical protein N7474_009165 [Penicillium riverlandense]
MPIPTRSSSLRDPRGQVKRPRPTNEKATPSIPSPVEGASVKDNATVKRTLLPQRGTGQVRFQPPDSKLPQRDVSPKRSQQICPENVKQDQPESQVASSGAAPGRRQSLRRPGTLKIPSTKTNVSGPTKSPAPSFAPPSPRKYQAALPSKRPPSPKRTDMPPPPRPVRSASLRQPTHAGPPAAARGHARHRSQVVPTSAKQAEITPKSRTPFSTYQQHYSPRKPGVKPPTPTPGTTPDTGSLQIPSSWPDTTALQTELLQLSLFHSTSLQRHSEWKSQSASGLHKKYNAVANQYRSVLADEKTCQYQLNMHALNDWLQKCHDHTGSSGFPEQIQTLSQVLQDVSDLGGVGGRYARAVQLFEEWLERADEIRNYRKSARAMETAEFIDPLDRAWKEELHGLQSKLELCARQLQSLDILGFGDTQHVQHSALIRVVQNLVDYIQLMTEEIGAMRILEGELVRSEREFACQRATQLANAPRETRAPRAGAWTVV